MSEKTPAEIDAALNTAADRRAYVAECRKEFEATPNIYAIEYVYRHHYWSTDRRGRVRAVSYVGKKRTDDPGLVFWKTVPDGVYVAVRGRGDELSFGWSRLARGDRWNKYIGLSTAIRRAGSICIAAEGTAFRDFTARVEGRIIASRNRKLYGNEAGRVSITARGDTRIVHE